MPPEDSVSRGLAAAFGRRRRTRSKIRRWLLRQTQRLEFHVGRLENADALYFVPSATDRAQLADLSARINWYLPSGTRSVPVFVDGATEVGAFSPEDAPFMAPELVRSPGWVAREPAGRSHLVVHRLTPRTSLTYLRRIRSATLVDPSFAYGTEEAFFRLHRRFCETVIPDPVTSVERLLSKRVAGGSALVLATGPSASLVDPKEIHQDVRIICNSAVRDHELLRELSPDVIVFSDPVFHFGPSRYAAAFRQDLRNALETTGAVFLTTQLFVEPLVAHMPEIRQRLAVIPVDETPSWRWPTVDDPGSRMTGNVLTALMLPAAFALADEVTVAGCDGRNRNERYFWKHNANTQYSDQLMRAVFEVHPAFFRDRDYADYYDEHCRQLEEFFSVAESAGKTVTGLTPSHIPALRRRGAPPF
jgi:hypothetical protein